MKTPIIIDTDVGTDVDDLFALTYAIRNPYCDVKSISTVIGDTEIRAKIALKLEKILRVDIPVITGKSGSCDCVSKYWTGIEENVLNLRERRAELPNTRFRKAKVGTKLVCLGPLTNISYQLKCTETLNDVSDVYVMGLSDKSHNFKADLESMRNFFNQPWNIYQITKEVSEKVCFDRSELMDFKGNELGDFLYDSAMNWLDYTERDKCCMYDVLTVSAAFDDYVKFERVGRKRYMSVDVDLQLKDKLIECIRFG
ncbi:nucleoside hydrolase [Candidatus Pacearchaeota archaeon]|nr:nucleoside hydrolase [Candidatus Pacearchaeota archaeon]